MDAATSANYWRKLTLGNKPNFRLNRAEVDIRQRNISFSATSANYWRKLTPGNEPNFRLNRSEVPKINCG